MKLDVTDTAVGPMIIDIQSGAVASFNAQNPSQAQYFVASIEAALINKSLSIQAHVDFELYFKLFATGLLIPFPLSVSVLDHLSGYSDLGHNRRT